VIGGAVRCGSDRSADRSAVVPVVAGPSIAVPGAPVSSSSGPCVPVPTFRRRPHRRCRTAPSVPHSASTRTRSNSGITLRSPPSATPTPAAVPHGRSLPAPSASPFEPPSVVVASVRSLLRSGALVPPPPHFAVPLSKRPNRRGGTVRRRPPPFRTWRRRHDRAGWTRSDGECSAPALRGEGGRKGTDAWIGMLFGEDGSADV